MSKLFDKGLHAGIKLTGPVESSATIVARNEKVRCMRWNRTELIKLLEKEKTLRRSFQSVLIWDVVSKLKAQRKIILRKTLRRNDKPEEVVAFEQSESEFQYVSILHNLLAREEDVDIKKYKEDMDQYRLIHHISDDCHRRALEHCGWTEEEYMAGKKMKAKKE